MQGNDVGSSAAAAGTGPDDDFRFQPAQWQSLTPLDLMRFARGWTIGSWLFVSGSLVALLTVGWSAGYSYRAGTWPAAAYALHSRAVSPLHERLERERRGAFAEHYDSIIDWQKLRPIIRGIATDSPDGLTTEFEIAASLLAQVRSSLGEARFLSGREEQVVRIVPSADGASLTWEEQDSLIPRIALDAKHELSDEELRAVNSNINWASFSYLDDAMEKTVIFRRLDGGMTLQIRRE